MKVWLTSHKQEECWGPFNSVPEAWNHLFGHSCETPEGIEEVHQHHEAGWTVNEVQLFPVKK